MLSSFTLVICSWFALIFYCYEYMNDIKLFLKYDSLVHLLLNEFGEIEYTGIIYKCSTTFKQSIVQSKCSAYQFKSQPSLNLLRPR